MSRDAFSSGIAVKEKSLGLATELIRQKHNAIPILTEFMFPLLYFCITLGGHNQYLISDETSSPIGTPFRCKQRALHMVVIALPHRASVVATPVMTGKEGFVKRLTRTAWAAQQLCRCLSVRPKKS